MQNYLKTGLKKSNVCKAVIVILIFSLQPALLFSLEIDHRIYQQDDQITLILQLNDFPLDKVQQVFQTGQNSQVQFEVRLFNKSEGVWGFLGDQLLEEQNIIYNGSFDPFSNMYRLETTTENSRTKIRDYLEVASFFSALRSVRISFPSPPPLSSTTYLRLRVKFTPRLLMPPLNVLEPFLLDHQITTGWTQVPIPDPKTEKEAET